MRSPENTELVRTFELLQDLTQTRTPEEVLHSIRLQMDRYVYLQSANRRLDYLLHMVIQPEERMFADEYDSSTMTTITRREALDTTLTRIHDDFDRKVTKARRVIMEQRDTADEVQQTYFEEARIKLNFTKMQKTARK